jgi:hypothetical protein
MITTSSSFLQEQDKEKRHEIFGKQKLTCPICRETIDKDNILKINPHVGSRYVGRHIIKKIGYIWYPGRVSHFDEGTHTVIFEDGETINYHNNTLTNWLLLANKKNISTKLGIAYFDDIDQEIGDTEFPDETSKSQVYIDKGNQHARNMYNKWVRSDEYGIGLIIARKVTDKYVLGTWDFILDLKKGGQAVLKTRYSENHGYVAHENFPQWIIVDDVDIQKNPE